MLERLTVRTIAISLPLLTVGLAAGFVRLREQRRADRRADGRGDASPGSSTRAFVAHAARRGRRAAYLALVGFALVILARVVLAGSHF